MKRAYLSFFMSSFLLVTSVSTASAHTILLSSSPKAGSVVASMPSTISLTFNEGLLTIAGKSVNTLSIKDSAGHRLDQGLATVNEASLSVKSRKSSQTGKFTVQYRVISADGHPVTGSFVFTVKQ